MPTDSSYELFAWFFMRVSGVILLFLAIGHLVIMHLLNHVDTLNYDFVAKRWATPFWRTYDALMLTLALIHGMNGLRIVVDDYLRPGGLRTVCLSLLYVIGFIFLLMGLMILFTFQPV